MLHCARRRFQERPCMAEIFAKAVKVDGCSSRCVRFNAPSEYARRKGEGKCSRRQGATGPAPHLRRAARAGEHRRPERAREGQGAFGEVGAGGACNVHCTAEGGGSRKVRPWCRMERSRDGWCPEGGRRLVRKGDAPERPFSPRANRRPAGFAFQDQRRIGAKRPIRSRRGPEGTRIRMTSAGQGGQ